MNLSTSRYLSWQKLALAVLLCYPVMASSYLPFGGGARYLSVLAAPICLGLIFCRPRGEWLSLARAALMWGRPFVPMAVGWLVARVWHQYDPLDLTPVSRLLFACLLYVGARQLGIKHWHLAYAAAFGALVCGVIAGVDVLVLARGRAWGGVYENRFAQYAVWFAVLCLLHAIRFNKEGSASPFRFWLLVVAIPIAIMGALLTASRGALLALPIAVVLAFVRSFTWRRAMVFAAAAMTISVLSILCHEPFRVRYLTAYQEFIGYFTESSYHGTSVGARLELARIALLSLSVNPWIGVGYQSLGTLYAQYPQLLGAMPASISDIPSFHSDWFHAIGVGGIFLLSALMLSVAWLFVAARRDLYRTCLITCSVVFSVSELFFWHKMGLSLLVTTWALYSAAEDRL